MIVNNTKKYKILTPSGFRDFSSIRKLEKDCFKITTNNGIIMCSYDHMLYSAGRYILAEDIIIGTKIESKFGESVVLETEYIGLQTVYDIIDVDGGHLYYTNSFKSHNCSFEGSSYTLINGKKFASIVAKDPIKTTLKNFKINIYEEPQEGHYYTIGVDTAKYGDGDFMSIQVIDITSKPFKQVAAFREKNMTYLNLVEPLYNIGTYYNCAHMFIENNSGDGQSSADLLMNNYDYENIYSEKIGVLGFRTTTKSRRIGLQNLKQLIEDDMLILNDEESIAELMRFALKNGKYQATDGYNDDSVMAIVASLYFLQLRNWVDVEDIHKFFSRTEYSEDEDDEPFIFGFMDDGSNNMIPF